MRKMVWFILSSIPLGAFTQTNVFDSIRNRLKIENNDTEQVRLLVQLGNKIKYKDTVEAWLAS